jgi:hypothetical protein
MKILLGDFNSKVGRKCIFKLTIGNQSLHKISRVVNFLPYPKIPVKSKNFPHCNIHKFRINGVLDFVHHPEF